MVTNILFSHRLHLTFVAHIVSYVFSVKTQIPALLKVFPNLRRQKDNPPKCFVRDYREISLTKGPALVRLQLYHQARLLPTNVSHLCLMPVSIGLLKEFSRSSTSASLGGSASYR